MESNRHRFLDEWLVQALLRNPLLSNDKVNTFRLEKADSVVDSILDNKIMTTDQIAEVLRSSYGINVIDINPDQIEKLASSMIPEKLCRKSQMLPFRIHDDSIDVAMSNPLNIDALNDVRALTGRNPIPFYCWPNQLEVLINKVFNPDVIVYDLLERIEPQESVDVIPWIDTEAPQTTASLDVRTPIIKLVNSIISKAVHMGASDIHIEHEENNSIVRYRVDGILKNILVLPKSIAVGPVVSRIKIISNLDVADHFRPQDGRAKFRVGEADIGFRISTLPTSHGEKIVMRILDKRVAQVPFEKLGFQKRLSDKLEAMMQNEQGTIFVTGPTGSGKTTTLYSMLNKLKSEGTNIVTVEDPVEYKLEGINQVQVNEKQGLDFSTVLRSVLRQDPDIILVGEIRDIETAKITIQSAMTGHLVFSTIHTNDTVSTISRLLDIGVDGYKIASGLIGITAQRLVRRLCPDCKKEVSFDKTDPAIVTELKNRQYKGTYFESRGCKNCHMLGYKGRLPILEVWSIDNEMKKLIAGEESEGMIRQSAIERGALYPLIDDALWQLDRGETSLAEILPHIQLITHQSKKQLKPKENISAFIKAPPVVQPMASVINLVPQKENVNPLAKKILVADDDRITRVILRKALEKEGYIVDEAEDGTQVLEKIVNTNPDLLLLDLLMPEFSGEEVLQSIRQTLGLQTLPVVVLTTVSDEKIKEKILSMGANDYVTKPFNPTLVVARINAVFRRLKTDSSTDPAPVSIY